MPAARPERLSFLALAAVRVSIVHHIARPNASAPPTSRRSLLRASPIARPPHFTAIAYREGSSNAVFLMLPRWLRRSPIRNAAARAAPLANEIPAVGRADYATLRAA